VTESDERAQAREHTKLRVKLQAHSEQRNAAARSNVRRVTRTESRASPAIDRASGGRRRRQRRRQQRRRGWTGTRSAEWHRDAQRARSFAASSAKHPEHQDQYGRGISAVFTLLSAYLVSRPSAFPHAPRVPASRYAAACRAIARFAHGLASRRECDRGVDCRRLALVDYLFKQLRYRRCARRHRALPASVSERSNRLCSSSERRTTDYRRFFVTNFVTNEGSFRSSSRSKMHLGSRRYPNVVEFFPIPAIVIVPHDRG